MPEFKHGRIPPPFGPDISHGKDFTGGVSKTKQSFANESDINMIMAKFHRTGVLMDPTKISSRKAFFGDISGLGDFQEIQNKVLAAEVAFGDLPSEIRTRFDNKPAELVKFLQDEGNREEAIELGIVEAPPEEPVETPPVVPPDPTPS